MATDPSHSLMYFGWCTGLIKGAAIPPHGALDAHCEGAHAYLPGGRPGKPGKATLEVEQNQLSLAVKLDSVKAEDPHTK